MGSGRIIVGVDGSEGSAHALRWCGVYGAELGYEVVAVHVVPLPVYAGFVPTGATLIDDKDTRDRLLSIVRETWCAPLRETGAKYDGLVVQGNAPWMLIDVADREDADMIVVGGRGRGGFTGLLLGSTGHHLAHHARRPLIIVPAAWTPGTDGVANPIIVGVDGSEGSDRALRWSIDLARALETEVVAVHVLEMPWRPGDAVESAEIGPPDLHNEFVGDWCNPLREGGVRHRTILAEGNPARGLMAVAEWEGAGLLVLGSRGRGVSAFTELLLGSVGHKVAHHARVPVAIVPRPA